MHRPFILGLTAALLVTAPVSAQAPEFLPVNQAVKVIADGNPWSALTANGRRAKITLNKDGTGKFEGPITLSISWEVEGQNLCIKLGMPGTKCLRFRQMASAYEGFAGGKLDLTLSR